MKYQHLRHATGLLRYGGVDILLDPMLAPKEVNPPIKNSWNNRRNPLTDFPLELSSFIVPEHCLVTHLHPDHFDDFAKKKLPKNIRLVCQTENEDSFKNMGFTNTLPISDQLNIDSISIHRVPGQHGTGRIAELMGTSSGYVLNAPSEPTLYITGDTIFYDEVKATLEKYKPDIIIAFGGTAQFAEGDPITLTPEDILQIYHSAAQAKIICVHMDAINHCRTTRNDLKEFLSTELNNSKDLNVFIIPEDNELLEF